jgi:hypothetical protein
MALIETLILIPVRDNDGEPYTRETYDTLHRRLAAEGWGWSIAREIEGGWANAGIVYIDESQEWLVALNSWTQLPAWLAVVEWIRVTFRQEAMFVRVAGVYEEIGPS